MNKYSKNIFLFYITVVDIEQSSAYSFSIEGFVYIGCSRYCNLIQLYNGQTNIKWNNFFNIDFTIRT